MEGVSSKIFNTRAEKYDNLKWIFNSTFSSTILTFAKPSKNDIMLDLGVGTGALSYLFHRYVKTIYAIDNSMKMLKKAQVLLKDVENVFFDFANGEDTKFASNFFDIILCRNTLHHFDNPIIGLEEINRIIKERGLFVLIEPVAQDDNGLNLWKDLFMVRDKGRHEDFFFTPDSIDKYITKHGFTKLEENFITIDIPMSNWLDIGTLTTQETDSIYKRLANSSKKELVSLNIRKTPNDVIMEHFWTILKYKSKK